SRSAPCDAAPGRGLTAAPHALRGHPATAREALCAGSGKNLVLLEDVGLRYGAGPEILQHVTYTLAPGSFHFLVGPSGAGKSSLLRLMYLAQRPTSGLISLFGRDVASLRRHELPALRRRIGVVFQDFRLIEHLSAFDNA